MRAPIFWALAMSITLPGTLVGQDSLPPKPAVARLADFGLENAGSVVRGRVSVAHTSGGPRLGVYFLRDRARRAPVSAPPAVPAAPRYSTASSRELASALWVWNTRQLLDDPGERAVFLDFVADQGIRGVFLYLPPAPGQEPRGGFVPFDGPGVGSLVADLGRVGAVVHGLDGDPTYALPENHAGVWRTVERVVEHNRTASPEERLHGVRFDVEPYLVPGFQGPRREALLDGYVTLMAGVAARTEGTGLKVGVDIPFWLDGPDEETGEPLMATLQGVRRPVLHHLLDLVDNVAIMDYRTQANGPDGAVAHARGELEAAKERGVGVFVGVETAPLVDEDLYTFSGPGRAGLPPAEPGPWIVLAPREDDGVALWVVDGTRLPASVRDGNVDALRHWPAGRPVRVSADKQSFATLGPDLFESETQRLARLLEAYPAFLGLAFHDYPGLRRLIQRR